VLHSQGTYHGFLILRDLTGKLLADGDLVQVAHGDRVTARLTFHFRDGSVDDETTVFTQRKTFQMVSDHHVQRGPSFPKPIDYLIEANGKITIRQPGEKPGDPVKVETNHIDLPPDTYNGLEFTTLINISPRAPETKVAMVAPTGKGRLVHLSIKPVGDDPFTLGFVRHKAIHYQIHVDLGGIVGVVAPLIGKQPEDYQVWVLDGDAPALVKFEGQLYDGGPIWRIELDSPRWPGESRATR
jgi:hypothetical protein